MQKLKLHDILPTILREKMGFPEIYFPWPHGFSSRQLQSSQSSGPRSLDGQGGARSDFSPFDHERMGQVMKSQLSQLSKNHTDGSIFQF